MGPMINSKKITCTGVKILGYIHPRNNGKETVRMMGM